MAGINKKYEHPWKKDWIKGMEALHTDYIRQQLLTMKISNTTERVAHFLDTVPQEGCRSELVGRCCWCWWYNSRQSYTRRV